MALIKIKQINNSPASEGGLIVYNGVGNVWSNNDDGAVLVSKGTTGQRPGSPTEGFIRYNTTLDCLEAYIAGAWECLQMADPGGGVATFQITGSDTVLSEPMAFVTDTTRSSKVLSVEATNLDFGHDAPDADSWFRPGNKHLDKDINGYILPYDGTVIRMSAHCANVKSNTKNLSVYINATETTNVVTLTTAAEDQDEATGVNINFSAGDKLRIRARNGTGGRIEETVVAVWVKWRKV